MTIYTNIASDTVDFIVLRAYLDVRAANTPVLIRAGSTIFAEFFKAIPPSSRKFVIAGAEPALHLWQSLVVLDPSLLPAEIVSSPLPSQPAAVPVPDSPPAAA